MMEHELPEDVTLPDGSILDPKVHARLLADIVNVSRTANVPVSMIHKSMVEFCTEREVEWFKAFHAHVKNGSAGVCFVGVHEKPAVTMMMALAGAFIRNYIDARVITLTALLQAKEGEDMPDPTVLMIPNFYIDFEGGKQLTAWQSSHLHDILMERMVAARVTLLYVSSFEAMEKHYGEAMVQFIKAHWLVFSS